MSKRTYAGLTRASAVLALSCLALIGVGWAITLERIAYERRQAIEEAVLHNSNLALAFEEHTIRTVKGLDRVVRFIRHEYREHGRSLNPDYLTQEGSLDLAVLNTAGLVDEHGDIVVAVKGAETANVAHRDYFQYHRENAGDELRVGPPLVGRLTGRPTIHVTRRIDRADGSFAGVAVVGIDPDYFASFYNLVDLGPRGLVVLLGTDGTVRARRDGADISAGQDMRDSSLYRQLVAASSGSLVSLGRIDGTPRYVSYRQLRDYPLVVAVATSEAHVFGQTRQRAQNYVLGAALATLLVVLFGLGLSYIQRRQERAAAEVKRGEARYRTTFDEAGVGIAHAARDGRFLKVNRKLCELLGYSADELLARSWPDVTHPEDARRTAGLIAVAADDPAAVLPAIEKRYRRKDGMLLWGNATLAVVRDAEGRPDYFVTMLQDITARKEVEAALLESQAQFNQLANHIPEAFWIMDTRSRAMVYMSPAFEAICGRAPGPLVSGWCDWKALMHPEDTPYALPQYRYLPGGKLDVEHRIVRMDGSVRWVHARGFPIPGPDGEPFRVAGTIADVTERKRVEAEARESEARFRQLAENIREVFWLTDPAKNQMLYVSPAYAQIWGRSCESLYAAPRNWINAIHPEDRDRVMQAAKTRQASGEYVEEYRILRPDGTVRWIRDRAFPVSGNGGEVYRIAGIAEDITERRRAADELRESERRFSDMLSKVELVSIMLDRDARVTYCNDYLLRITGWSREEVLGRNWFELFIPPESQALNEVFSRLLSDLPEASHHENEILTRAGERRMIRWNNSVLRSAAGEVIGTASIGEDITESMQAQRAVANADVRYRATFDQAAVGIAHASLDGRYVKVNGKLCDMLGYAQEELLGRGFSEVCHPDDARLTREQVKMLLADPHANMLPELEKRYLRKDGSVLWATVGLSLVRDADGQPDYFVGMVQDVTARKLAQERLVHQAHYDALTGLPNRVLFYDRLEQLVNQARRHNWIAGALFVDVDHFKTVNDTLGHAAGDRLLQMVARRLSDSVRGGDTVARVGGDEFAIVLFGLAKAQDAAIVAEKILAALATPFHIDDHELFVAASIGIATYPCDGQDGAALVRNADAAMFRAKDNGRGNYQFYTAEMNERAMEKLLLRNDLRKALERNEFLLHFQPKASLVSGRITGFEALLRWKHPVRGLVSPGEFVPLLEDSGLIVPVGGWVIGAACRQLAAWRAAGREVLPVAVNLSAKQFMHHDLVGLIDQALTEHDVRPSLLELEITESDVMKNPAEAVKILQKLRTRDVHIAIDDFGTGYSSLSHLKRLPVDTLKIDRSFVSGLPEDADDASISRAVITMAHSLGLRVVAEGVETDAQRAFLARNDCDEMQGYLLARPQPAEEAAKLLRRASIDVAA